MLNKSVGLVYFFKKDLKDAYLQVSPHEISSEQTVISILFGLLKYKFLQFRLHVSPAMFHKVVNPDYC